MASVSINNIHAVVTVFRPTLQASTCMVCNGGPGDIDYQVGSTWTSLGAHRRVATSSTVIGLRRTGGGGGSYRLRARPIHLGCVYNSCLITPSTRRVA